MLDPRPSWLAGAVAFAGLARCGTPPPTDCTAIGASPVLRVVVPGVGAAESARVSAAALGTAPRAEEARLDTASRGCVGAACTEGVLLDAFAPDTAVVTVATRTRYVRAVVVPRYAVWYPNGPHCDPALRTGTVTVPARP